MTNNAGTALPPPPPGYVWARPTPTPPPWKPPLWLKVATAVWIVVLLAGGLYYALHGDATVRGQTTITQAQPVVDRAVADVVNAAGPTPIVTMSSFTKIDSCSITPVRGGFNYQRTATFYTTPGNEGAVLRSIASGLPDRYHARASASTPPSLYADAGDFVAVVGTERSPGQVLVRATTGCRTLGGRLASVGPPSAPSADVASVLSTLHVRPTSLARTQVVCANGRLLVTDSAIVPPSQVTGPLSDAAASLSNAPMASTDTLFAYRAPKSDVVLMAGITGLTITSTMRC